MQRCSLASPLLSRVVQFLPLQSIFSTLNLVCGEWAAYSFNFTHLKIEASHAQHIESIVKRLNIACVVCLEIYSETGEKVLQVARYFKNVKCLMVSTVENADFSGCESVKYLFVMEQGLPLGLPRSLVGLTMREALRCVHLLTNLPKLRSLGCRTRLKTIQDFQVLDMLQIATACFETRYDRTQNMHVPAGWAFAFSLTTPQSTAFLQDDCQMFQALRHILIFRALTPTQFEVCGNLPCLESVGIGGALSWPVPTKNATRGRWPALTKLMLDNIQLDILNYFSNASILRTIIFRYYLHKHHHFPYLPQVTTVVAIACSLRFIKKIPLQMVELLGVECGCITGSTFVLQSLRLPTYTNKIYIRTRYWDVQQVQLFLSAHSFSEVTFLLEKGFYGKTGELVVPPPTTMRLSSLLENRFVYHGRVHFIDERRLMAFSELNKFENNVVGEFDECIKKFV